jgi:hypothetical protein
MNNVRRPDARKPNITNSTELQELLGRPALLRGESAKNYDDLQVRLMESLAPRDFLEQTLIAQYMWWFWEVRRYSHHKALSLEAGARRIAEAQRRQRLEQAKAAEARKDHLNDSEPSTEFGRICELEDNVESTAKDLDAILEGPQAEMINAQALRQTILSQLQLDKVLNDAFARQHQTFVLLERYRAGLGKQTQQACRDIIDAEFNETADETSGQPIPLVPSMGEGS